MPAARLSTLERLFYNGAMPRGWPKGKKRPHPAYPQYDESRSIPTLVQHFAAQAISRAKRNVEAGLALDAGSDPDAVLAALGLPPRSAVFDPHDISVDFITAEAPLRVHPRKRRRPAA